MSAFSKEISIRWSDLDPNFHLRHSAYYDFGAQHCIEVLSQNGLTMKVMQEQHFGPALFREECVFRQEIHLGSQVFIHTKIGKMKPDASRWMIVHELRNGNDELCATISVEGAWMNTKLRKLCTPTPQIVQDVMHAFPKAENFNLL